jgi:hypothetical protein
LRFASIFLSRFPSTPDLHLQNAAQNAKFLAAALWGASTPCIRSNEGEGVNPSPSRMQFLRRERGKAHTSRCFCEAISGKAAVTGRPAAQKAVPPEQPHRRGSTPSGHGLVKQQRVVARRSISF